MDMEIPSVHSTSGGARGDFLKRRPVRLGVRFHTSFSMSTSTSTSSHMSFHNRFRYFQVPLQISVITTAFDLHTASQVLHPRQF